MGYFKKPPPNEAKDRMDEYKASKGPDGTNYHKAKTRKNAYVFVNKGSSTQLPSEANTYDALYSNREGAPDVILNGVTVNRGPDLGMLRTADVEFECLRRDVFNKYYAAYLKPGSKISIEYGYTDGSATETADDLEVAKFAFELTEKNTYKCSFRAYGATPFLNEVEVAGKGSYEGKTIRTGGFFNAPVSTLPQYLKYVAQGGGVMANVDIANWTKREDGAVIIIDNPNGVTPPGGPLGVAKAVYKILQSLGLFASDSSKKIYCTLEWFVNNLYKYHVKPQLKKNMKNRVLVCRADGTHAHPMIGSAYPMNIALPGGPAGNYGSDAGIFSESKINFADSGKIAVDGKKGNYNNILLSYDYLVSKVFGQSKEKGAIKNSNTAAKSGKANKPPKVTLKSVMQTIFDDIYAATGGVVHLAMQEDDTGDGTKEFVVISKNNYEGMDPVVFDPIEGDGITRKCTVKCDVPSSDAYAVANGGAGAGGSGHVADALSDEDPPPTDTELLNDAKKTIKEYMDIGLSANDFDNEDCAALEAAFKTVVDKSAKEKVKEMSFDNQVWPLNLEIELDGTPGFKFGTVVSSTFLPPNEGYEKVVFTCTDVTNTISGNDWSTTLKTQCTLR